MRLGIVREEQALGYKLNTCNYSFICQLYPLLVRANMLQQPWTKSQGGLHLHKWLPGNNHTPTETHLHLVTPLSFLTMETFLGRARGVWLILRAQDIHQMMSTWQKLKSSEKRKPQLRKCLLNVIRKQTESMESRPISSIPLWTVHQLLPQVPPALVPALTSLHDNGL